LSAVTAAGTACRPVSAEAGAAVGSAGGAVSAKAGAAVGSAGGAVSAEAGAAGGCQYGCASFGENRLSRAFAIEQCDAELHLEIGDRVANGGCGAAQPTACRGETAGLHNSQEYPELVEAGRSDIRHF
jgi:hypothetical protein